MITWLTDTLIGKMTMTFLISMLPVVELRLGLPYGIAIGLAYPLALIAAVAGNLLPVPFIILFIKNVLAFLRTRLGKLDGFITRIEERAHLKSELVTKYGPVGLFLLVAIPCMCFYAWFRRVAERRVAELECLSADLVTLLLSRRPRA